MGIMISKNEFEGSMNYGKFEVTVYEFMTSVEIVTVATEEEAKLVYAQLEEKYAEVL